MVRELPIETRYWQAVVNREREMDGVLYYGVISTGVYCRPSCASRKPARENVLFFVRREEAEKAGFRACLRCKPDQASANPRFDLVQQACRYLEAHLDETVSLQRLGRELGVSPFHIQRTFKAVLGVSPRAWIEARRLELFKGAVRNGATVTEAIYDAGYGSSSALYGRAPTQLGMSPATYGKGGAGLRLDYSIMDSALGKVLIAATPQGVCAIRFGDSEKALEAALAAEFPRATLARGDANLAAHARALERAIAGSPAAVEFPLDIRATAFQRRVWECLRSIPAGETRSYAEVAAATGNPRATRAVARACASNPVAVAIPCHRVIASDGGLGGYRWGVRRKKALLDSEKATARSASDTARQGRRTE